MKQHFVSMVHDIENKSSHRSTSKQGIDARNKIFELSKSLKKLNFSVTSLKKFSETYYKKCKITYM